jgi:hypothetical protein
MSDYRVRAYLLALSRLALEVAHNQRLLPVFVAIIKLVPATLSELRRGDQRRIAA